MKPALHIVAPEPSAPPRVVGIFSRRDDADIQSMPDDWGVKIEVAADKRRKEIEAARDGTSAQEELA